MFAKSTLILPLVLGSLLAGCHKDKSEPAELATITVTLQNASMEVGQNQTLSAEAKDQNGNVMNGVVFTWSSSDTGVATLNGAVATGVAAGSTGITASSGAVTSNSVTLTVTAATPHVAAIVVTLAASSIAVGETETSTAVATDQFGAVMAGVTFTWNSSDTNVASVADGVASGIAAGTTNISASSGGVASNLAALTVTQVVAQDFRLEPSNVKLTIDRGFGLLARESPGPLTWTSSNPAVATVDASGQVTAIAKGSAVITATSGAAIATANVKVFRTTGANADPTSDALIAQALAAGTITSEQALEYRVFALFADARLPAQYDGAPVDGPDHMLMRDVRSQLSSLSQSAQDVLNPFFAPPIYTDSAYAQSLSGASIAKRTQAAVRAGPVRPLDISDNCRVTQNPTVYGRVSVTTPDNKFTFNVFHSVPRGDQAGRDVVKHLAELIATVALEDYTAQTGLFGIFPIADGGQPCNGSDAGIDFYLLPSSNLNMAGQTITYTGQCANSPSFVMLNEWHPVFFNSLLASPQDGRAAIKSVVAHELLHVLQLAMPRQASCADTKWFDEATAEWAMDFAVPKFPVTALAAPGLEDGLNRVSGSKRRSGSFYAEYLYSGHMRSLEQGVERNFGYADYLFSQYLARTQTEQSIRFIYDAMAAGNNSLESIDASIDMTAVWPEFAKTLWNDVTNNVLTYWQTTDDYDFGLADVFANPGSLDGAPTDLKPLEIDQKGKSDEVFTLLDNALERSASGDYEIAPRSIIYEKLKFTDPTVHTVTFTNPIAGDPDNQYVKLWVVKKIAGAWQAPEDWTEQPIKAFCLDAKAERLEELLVIVSNSEINPNIETPYRISLRVPMQVATTNVGCWRWQGTASLTTHTVDGPVTVQSATVNFVQAKSVAAGLPDAGLSLGYLMFGTFTDSTASYSISGFNTALNCTVTGNANAAMVPQITGPFVNTDGNMIVNFGLPDPLHRAIIATGRTLITDVPETYACPGQTEVITTDKTVEWLSIPQPPGDEAPTVSDDGQTIGGRWTRTDEEGDKVSEWDLHAVREQ